MKRKIRVIMLTLLLLLIFNAKSKNINAQDINNKSQNTVGIESQIRSSEVPIDPEAERK